MEIENIQPKFSVNLTRKEKMKDYMKEYNKMHYDKVKSEWKQKYGAEVVCECGATVTKYNLYAHKKSNKHMKNLMPDMSPLEAIKALQDEIKIIKEQLKIVQ